MVKSDRYVGRVPGTEILVRRIDAGEGGNAMVCITFEAPPEATPPGLVSMCGSPHDVGQFSASGAEFSVGLTPVGTVAVIAVDLGSWARPVDDVFVFPVGFDGVGSITFRFLDDTGSIIAEQSLQDEAAARAAAMAGGSETGRATYYNHAPVSGGCAHRTLPIGTVVTVTNDANGKSTTCTVKDRGPYGAGRVIDMHPDEFEVIAELETGVIDVTISW